MSSPKVKSIIAPYDFLAGEGGGYMEESFDNFLGSSESVAHNIQTVGTYIRKTRVKLRKELNMFIRVMHCRPEIIGLRQSNSDYGWLFEVWYANSEGKTDLAREVTDEDFRKVAMMFLPSYPQCHVPF